MASEFLPYGRQCIEADDIAAVTRVLESDWLTTGPVVDEFEQAFAAMAGCCFAIACSSGTAGLHLAALALGLKDGDKAAVPSITFQATANAARYVGAEVAFVDVDSETGLIDVVALQKTLDADVDKRIKSVFPVHLNGQCADMVAIAEIARKNGLTIVEDACHVLGGTCLDATGNATPVGSCAMSDMTVFSLHPVKTIAMGEGGVVTTNDEELCRRLRTLRNHGMVGRSEALKSGDQTLGAKNTLIPVQYEMQELGYNYRASDIHCALGASQLKKLDRFVTRRRELADLYDTRLEQLAPLVRPIARTKNGTPAWHLYVVLIDFAKAGIERASVMRQLRDAGIGTQVHFIPVQRQPYYRERYGELSLPGSNTYYDKCLSLPLFPDMKDDDVDRVVKSLEQILTAVTH